MSQKIEVTLEPVLQYRVLKYVLEEMVNTISNLSYQDGYDGFDQDLTDQLLAAAASCSFPPNLSENERGDFEDLFMERAYQAAWDELYKMLQNFAEEPDRARSPLNTLQMVVPIEYMTVPVRGER